MNEIGIDIGSGFTKVVRRTGDGAYETRRLPSCLFVVSESEVLIGEAARERFEEASALPGAARDGAMACYFDSFMADLSVNARHALPGCTMTDQDLLTRFLRKIHSQMADSRVVAFAHDPNWTEQARKRLLDAAESAGFEEISLLEGPVSVVWGCENENMAEKRHFLVLDAGESRFSVSYVERDAKKGACHLIFREEGRFCGRLMDEKLYDYAEKRLKLPVSNDHDPILLRACREAREKLSKSDSAMVFNLRITRAELEGLLENDWLEAESTLHAVLDRLEDQELPLDAVIFGGGCANMPAWHKRMKKLLDAFSRKRNKSRKEQSLDSVKVLDFLPDAPGGVSARGAIDAWVAQSSRRKKGAGPIDEKGRVSVTVESVPSGAEITLDGKMIGTAPVSVPIESGKHQVVATLWGYEEAKGTFTSNRREDCFKTLTLKPFIGVHVTSTPSGAAVYVDEERSTSYTTPCRIALAPGKMHLVDVEKPDYVSQQRRFEYHGDEMGSLHVELVLDEDLIRRREEEEKHRVVEKEESRKREARKKAEEVRRKANELWEHAEEKRCGGLTNESIELYKTLEMEFKDVRAMHRLCEFCWHRNLEEDRKNARIFFSNAAQRGFAPSITALARIAFVDGDYKKAVELYKQAETADPAACRELNTCRKYGWWGLEKNESPDDLRGEIEERKKSRWNVGTRILVGLVWLILAVYGYQSFNCGVAYYYSMLLGLLLGWFVLPKAVMLGCRSAGLYKTMPADMASVLEKRLALSRTLDGCVQIGPLMGVNNETPVEQNVASGQFSGLFHAAVIGGVIVFACAPAFEYGSLRGFSREIERRHSQDAYQVGVKHFYGYGTAINYVQAFSHFKKAAERGHADAQNFLGVMYLNENGVAKNDALAFEWFKKGAEQGNALAELNLGWMYANGHGTATNFVEGFAWMRRSAEQGNAQAQTYLGVMYRDGLGVARDVAEAKRWLQKAAAQGNKDAEQALNAVIGE